MFRPTPKDENQLSVYDGDKITPEASWAHYTNTPACKSSGVLAISLQEAQEQELPVIADGMPFPEHCFIDFTALTKRDIEKKAKKLASYAVKRDWLFQRAEE